MENDRLDKLLRKADVRPYDCYQCGKCSGGCPMAESMDLKPRGIMRQTQVGDVGAILKSNTIWLCTGCHTCVERCPHDVNIPALIEEARYMAAEEGYERRDSQVLNEVFMANVRMFGRNHEMVLAGAYNMLALKPLQDMMSVPHMINRKLLGIKPHQIKELDELEKIFENAEKWEEQER